jgi:hypothetical protein
MVRYNLYSVFLDFVHLYILIKLLRFGSWISFRLQVKRGG